MSGILVRPTCPRRRPAPPAASRFPTWRWCASSARPSSRSARPRDGRARRRSDGDSDVAAEVVVQAPDRSDARRHQGVRRRSGARRQGRGGGERPTAATAADQRRVVDAADGDVDGRRSATRREAATASSRAAPSSAPAPTSAARADARGRAVGGLGRLDHGHRRRRAASRSSSARGTASRRGSCSRRSPAPTSCASSSI